MAKQGKSRKTDPNNNVGKGKVTPVQVAFIVDRYLADNNFSNTRAAFRSEASSLISKSTLQEAPKSLLSLGELLDEYIWLKEQKVIIDQEKFGLAQEKSRVHTLFQGMQDLMNAFNSPVSTNSALTPSVSAPVASATPNSMLTSSSGYNAYRTPIMVSSTSMTQNMKMDHSTYTTPIVSSRPPRKRKNSKDIQDVPQAPKKYCVPITNNNPSCSKGTNSVAQPNNASSSHHHSSNNHQSPPLQSVSPSFTQGGVPPIQGSSVAKNLFNKPSTSPYSNSSGPKTPPRALSSQSDKSTSPLEDDASTANKSNNEITPPENTPANCTFISSKTIIVSPDKHFSFERNQCTFSSPVKTNNRQSKREQVKGRLDFDSSDVVTNMENPSGDGSSGSTSSESEKEEDIFDLALQKFDDFGPDFSLSEFLTDIGIDCDGLDYTCPTTSGASTDAAQQQELLHEGNNNELGTNNNQDVVNVKHSEVFAGDMSVNGTDSITSVKSIRKCILLSPSKSARNSSIHGQGSLNEGN